jgi:hypothetical protein
MTDWHDPFTIGGEGDPMPNPTPETAGSSAAARQHIWELYEARQLDMDQVTVALLRVDLAARRALRAPLPPSTQ